MSKIAGLDVGFSKTRKSSGVGIFDEGGLAVELSLGGPKACNPVIAKRPFDVIAIDGPMIPRDKDPRARRRVEALFLKGLFQKRCKPGLSDTGTGLNLRLAAQAAADMLSDCAPLPDKPKFPLVRRAAIVEAFPNLFLGVCLSDATFANKQTAKKRMKFDWLYEQWVEQKTVARCSPLSRAEISYFQKKLTDEKSHDKRAAIICVLTGIFVARGDFVAVGDEEGGWFFLPPFAMWADWARNELHKINRQGTCEVIACQSKGKWPLRWQRLGRILRSFLRSN